jgi:hypothetical protein
LQRGLARAVSAAPSPSFAEGVMARIDVYERDIDRVREQRAWTRTAAAGVALASATCTLIAAIVFLGSPHETREAAILTARGSIAAGTALERWVGIETFLHRGQTRARLEDGGTLSPSDGLTFTVHNRSGRRLWLMIFGIDAEERVHWFYPEVGGRSIAVAAAPQSVALPEGVTPEEAVPGRFHLIALFSDRALETGEIERRIRDQGLDRLQLDRRVGALSISDLEMRDSAEAGDGSTP